MMPNERRTGIRKPQDTDSAYMFNLEDMDRRRNGSQGRMRSCIIRPSRTAKYAVLRLQITPFAAGAASWGAKRTGPLLRTGPVPVDHGTAKAPGQTDRPAATPQTAPSIPTCCSSPAPSAGCRRQSRPRSRQRGTGAGAPWCHRQASAGPRSLRARCLAPSRR